MALEFPWLAVAVAAVVVAAILAGVFAALRRPSHRDRAAGAAVSRAERLRALPSFRRATARRALALAAVVALAAVAALGAGAVAARPMAEQTVEPENTSRDIMLCLDVSGSMSDVDVEVLDTFEELIDGFEGERIGLTIFNSSPVQVFPLTDDYRFARTHLQQIRESFDYTEQIPEHWSGTLNGPGSSLVGDGLAACAMRFDHRDEERSRSIILATDNEVAGASTVTLEEAAGYAGSHGVRVFSLNPVQGINDKLSDELISAAELTGGAAYGLRETTTVSDIISDVQAQQATALSGPAEVVRADAPGGWIVAVVIVVMGLLVVVWRVRI